MGDFDAQAFLGALNTWAATRESTPKEVPFPKLDELTPPKYRTWKKSVETVLLLNKMSNDTTGITEAKKKRAAQLMLTALTDKAATQISCLDRTTLKSANEVFTSLEAIVLTSMSSALALTEFETMTQDSGEDVGAFAIRVRNQFQQAYPEADYKTDRAARRQLVTGLASNDLKKHALLQQKALDKDTKFDTLVDNLRMYEAVNAQLGPSKKIHQLGQPEAGQRQGASKPRGGNCHYCGQPGHFKRECPDLVKVAVAAFLGKQQGQGNRGGSRRGGGRGRGGRGSGRGGSGSGRGNVNALTDPQEPEEDHTPLFNSASGN